jgi:hypothetical protein
VTLYSIDLTKVTDSRTLEVRPVRSVSSNAQQPFTDPTQLFIQRDEPNQQWVGTAPPYEALR